MSKGWEELFGATSRNKPKNVHYSLMPNLDIQNIPKINNKIKESIGDHLFENIKKTYRLIQSKQIPPQAKNELTESLTFFKGTAQRDIKNLVDAQVLLITVEVLIKFNESQKHEFKYIIQSLDRLILNHVKQMRKLHCAVVFKTSLAIEKATIEGFCKDLIQTLEQNELQNAVTLLLNYQCNFNAEQSVSIFKMAQKIVSPYAQDLLSILNLRLFSKLSANPELIDYSSLTNNCFLQESSYIPDVVQNINFLTSTLQDLVTVHNNLWESKAKNQFNELILLNLNSLIEAMLHKSSNNLNVPFLSRIILN